MLSNEPTSVAIGLIGRDGRFLIRRRPERPGSPMPGVWEFPGGKCEEGETPEAAVVRECLEETGIAVRCSRLRREITHHYPHGSVRLHYLDCTTIDPDAEPAEGSGFVWMPAAELPLLTFPEANEPIVAALAAIG